jgi:hypothetical protein
MADHAHDLNLFDGFERELEAFARGAVIVTLPICLLRGEAYLCHYCSKILMLLISEAVP